MTVLEGVSPTVQGPTDVCDRKMGKVTGEEDKRRIEISAALTLPSTVGSRTEARDKTRGRPCPVYAVVFAAAGC